MTSDQGNNFSSISNLNKELDIDIAKTVFKKNWIWIILMLFIGVTTAFIYLRYTKSVYESKAVIQRSSKDEGQRILEFDDFIQDNNLSADVELLKSNFLLEKALRNLNLKISYFSEGEVLTEEKYTQSPYHVTFIELKDSSLINTPIYVINEDKRIFLEFNHNGKLEVIEVNTLDEIDNIFFKLKFKIDNKSKFYSDIEADKLYFRINNYKNLTAKLHKNLFVKIVNPDANTIEVAFRSNNKVLAKKLVSELIETFFEYDLEKRSESSANILKFIDEQLDTVYSNLKYSELDLQQFKSQSKTNNPEIYKENILSQIENLRKQGLEADL